MEAGVFGGANQPLEDAQSKGNAQARSRRNTPPLFACIFLDTGRRVHRRHHDHRR